MQTENAEIKTGNRHKKLITKSDILIVAALLALTAVVSFVLFFAKSSGKKVCVTVDGKTYGEYPLSQNQTVLIKTEKGQNTLVIKDGTACIMGADCPDKICENTGKIKNNGEVIVCLPHKMIAEIK